MTNSKKTTKTILNKQTMTRTTTYHKTEKIILSGQAYRNFAGSLRTQSTKNNYDFCLHKYMKYLNIQTVDDLLFLKVKNNVVDRTKTIETKLIDYIVALRKPPYNLTHKSRSTYLNALLTFYAMNDIAINRKKISRYLGEQDTPRHRDRAYTTGEIARLLQFCDERLKTIVYLLASTGIRLGALPLIRIGHLRPIKVEQSNYNNNNNIELYEVKIYANTRDEYYVYTTPEAKQAIDSYLEYRERCGETLTPDAPLLRKQFDSHDKLAAAQEVEPLALSSCKSLVDKALINSGVKVVSYHHYQDSIGSSSANRKEVSRFNGFRKFVNTNFIRAKVNPLVKEMLLGHTTGLDDNFYRPQSKEILQEYLKALDLITINNENRLEIKVKDLSAKADNITQIMKEQVEKGRELAELKKKMHQMQEREQKQKIEMAQVAKNAAMDTINQMLRNGQIPSPFMIDNGGLYNPNDPKLPRVAAAGKEQCKKFSIDQLKAMTPEERKEREKLLKKNKANDLLAEQQDFEKSLS